MKKIIISLFLVLCLMLASVVPAFATSQIGLGATPDQALKLSENVQNVYDVYVKLLNLIDEKNIDALPEAITEFEDVFYKVEDFTEEELDQISDVMGTDAMNAMFMLIDPYISANIVVVFNEYYSEYKNTPNTRTAYRYIEYYDSIFNEPEYKDEQVEAVIREFFPDADELYSDALADIPVGQVIDFYDAYVQIVDAIEMGGVEELQDAVDNFLKVHSSIEVLAPQDKQQIEELFSMPYEDAMAEAVDRYINANIILEIEKYINDFYDNENAQTAQAVVDMYNSIYNSDDFKSESLEDDIDTYFYGSFEEIYYYALEYIDSESDIDNSDEGADPQTGGDSSTNDKSTDANKATVKTGTNSGVVYITCLMMVLAYAVMMLVKTRKKIEH